MLTKTPEFLDAMCVFTALSKGNWFLVQVAGHGNFVWNENDPDKVFKIYNLDLWLESNEFGKVENSVNCPVRTVISKRAKILPYLGQPIELWLNIIIPESASDNIRVEPYLNQLDALSDAEQELVQNFEVHTRRVTIKVP